MPPRKRAASAPKTEPAQEPETLEAADTADTAGGDAAAEPDEAPADDSADQTPDAPKAERGDVQAAGKPCQECFPNGWPEGAFSVGCTHGTYVRKQD